MATIGQHKDAWGHTTNGCEVSIDHRNHGSWTLCGKTPSDTIGVYGDGSTRRLCQGHVNGALRTTTFYADSIVELRTADGETTHTLVRDRGRRGKLVKVTS